MFSHKQNFIPPPSLLRQAQNDNVGKRISKSAWSYVLIPLKLLPYFIAVILILAIGIGIFAGVSIAPYYASLKAVYAAGLNGQAELTAAQDFIVKQDFKSALASLTAAEKSFAEAKQGLGIAGQAAIFRSAPVKNQLIVAEDVVEIGSIVARSLKNLTAIGVEIQDTLKMDKLSWQGISSEKKEQMLAIMVDSVDELTAVEGEFKLAGEKLVDINRRQPLFIFDKAVNPLRDKIPKTQKAFGNLVTMAKLLPAFAGYPAERTYLFILENNREMRPSGGFIGTYGILKIENAEIKTFFTDNSYNLDQPYNTKLNIDSPAPMKQYMNQPKWFFRDSNWWPDWPTSAEKAEWFYEQEGGKEKLDGVIAITPTVIENLIGVLGEFKVGDMTFDKKNFWEKLQYEVEFGYNEKGVATSDRKDVIGDLGQQMLARLYTLPMSEWTSLIDLVSEEVQEKQILLYFNDAPMQQLAVENGWAGEVKDFSGDYLMLVDANLAALKTDSVMARTVKYSLTLENNTDSGTDKNTDKHADSYIAEAKVTYQNLGTFSWKTTRYRTYTRLYVPAGSDLIGVWADGVPLHAIDVRPGKVDVYSEFGKFAFGVFFEVEPQKAKTIVWKYKLPEAINAQIKNGEYSLLVQKQPGIIDFNLQLDLQFAQKIKQSVKGLSAAKNQIKHAEVVDRDQIYNVWLDE